MIAFFDCWAILSGQNRNNEDGYNAYCICFADLDFLNLICYVVTLALAIYACRLLCHFSNLTEINTNCWTLRGNRWHRGKRWPFVSNEMHIWKWAHSGDSLDPVFVPRAESNTQQRHEYVAKLNRFQDSDEERAVLNPWFTLVCDILPKGNPDIPCSSSHHLSRSHLVIFKPDLDWGGEASTNPKETPGIFE